MQTTLHLDSDSVRAAIRASFYTYRTINLLESIGLSPEDAAKENKSTVGDNLYATLSELTKIIKSHLPNTIPDNASITDTIDIVIDTTLSSSTLNDISDDNIHDFITHLEEDLVIILREKHNLSL